MLYVAEIGEDIVIIVVPLTLTLISHARVPTPIILHAWVLTPLYTVFILQTLWNGVWRILDIDFTVSFFQYNGVDSFH